MKKYLMILITILSFLSLGSCQKKNKSYDGIIVGFYLECLDLEEHTMKDQNPKIYLDTLNRNIFSTTTGNTGKSLSFDSTFKTITERNFIFGGTLTVPNDAFPNIDIYLIYEKDGKYYIESDVIRVMDLKNQTFSFQETYTYNELSYNIQITFKLNIKEYL